VVGVKMHTKFEVVDIMGDKDLYLPLQEIDLAYEDYVVIGLNKELIILEADELRVIQPLEPY